MIGAAWRRAVAFVRSAIFATTLLVAVAIWSMLGSMVPQGSTAVGEVAAWAAAHPVLEPVVRLVGLHAAHTAPLFLVCVLMLALSTALCAWERTKVGLTKAHILRESARSSAEAIRERHEFEIPVDPALGDEGLAVASETLSRLGLKMKRDGETLASVSPSWVVWGSPVFHWALVALIGVVLLSNLFRAEGLMGVAVGQTKPDVPDSYGFFHPGPLHASGSASRFVRVDGFDLNYRQGGMDWGPTPTVSLLDKAGKVIKSQPVYPNGTLKDGTLTIYPVDYGLAVWVALRSPSGASQGRGPVLSDFSADTTIGTVPLDSLDVVDASGQHRYRVQVSVPLDRTPSGLIKAVPRRPFARVVAVDSSGHTVQSQDVPSGGSVTLPNGGTLTVNKVTYYARLQLTDDAGIPLLYAGLVVATLGLGVVVLGRQQVVLATLAQRSDGPVLCVRIREWRNSTSSRHEIETELMRSIGGSSKEREE